MAFLVYEQNYLLPHNIKHIVCDNDDDMQFALFETGAQAMADMMKRKEKYLQQRWEGRNCWAFMDKESTDDCYVMGDLITTNEDGVREGVFHICKVELHMHSAVRTSDILHRSDIRLKEKLDDLLDMTISDDIYNRCMANFSYIVDKVWSLMTDPNEPFYWLYYFDKSPESLKKSRQFWKNCLHDCDLIYMQAIAYVLRLPKPKSSNETYMFN